VECLAATQFAIQSARDFSRLTRPEKDENSRELDSKAKNQPAVGRFDPEHVIGDQKGREDLGDVQTQKQRTLSRPFLGRR